MRKLFFNRGMNGATLWLGYLGLGAGFLYLLFNPQKAANLFGIIGGRVSSVLGWAF